MGTGLGVQFNHCGRLWRRLGGRGPGALCGALLVMVAAPALAASPWDGVQTKVAALVSSKAIPGAIVLVRWRGREVFLQAAGEADGAALNADTVIWIASMTKPVVAASVMMMVEEGKVRLEDPVSKYVPEFAAPRLVRTPKGGAQGSAAGGTARTPPPDYDLAPAARPMTVRDLITMTAGLQTIGAPNDKVPPVSDEDTLATYVAKLGDAPLDFQPGSRWAYSNATEFEVLARIVEAASGQPFANFVQQRIFDPLGMKDSHFGVRADLVARTAPLGDLAKSPLRTGRFASGSAGLWTTAEDYSHFAQMLLNGGRYGKTRLLRHETVAAMSRNQIGPLSLGGVNPREYGGLATRANPGVKYGYGLMAIEDPDVAGVTLPKGSFGWDGVGSRRFWVDPKDRLVLVMLIPGGDAPTAQRQIEAAVMTVVRPR